MCVCHFDAYQAPEDVALIVRTQPQIEGADRRQVAGVRLEDAASLADLEVEHGAGFRTIEKTRAV